MDYALRELHLVVEGGGAVGLAALLREMLDTESSSLPVVVVISGGNVATKQLLAISDVLESLQDGDDESLPSTEEVFRASYP